MAALGVWRGGCGGGLAPFLEVVWRAGHGGGLTPFLEVVWLSLHHHHHHHNWDAAGQNRKYKRYFHCL